MRVIAADVACSLCPFIEARQYKNDVFKEYAKLLYVLDSFHAASHKKKECQPGPESKYNPQAEKFKFLNGVNFEKCEQGTAFR